jgi:mitochondrial import inner membrane translocase subunit TIM23
MMNWPDFFKQRTKLAWMQRLAGIPAVFGFLTAEGAILAMPVFDPTQTIFGFDPLLAVGATTLVGSIASYFIGNGLASVIWRRFRPAVASSYDAKMTDFYKRVSKYRANVPPSPTELNFTLDFYGEKIRSIEDYKTWLRRQNHLKKSRLFKIQ